MSLRSRRAKPSSSRRDVLPSPDRKRAIRVFGVVALGFALLGSAMYLAERATFVSPEKLITVYRVHGCRCAFSWKYELEQQGFTVVLHEQESLRSIRSRLRTPAKWHGCHVGEYLGYFVEGHISPASLQELERQRPQALGLAEENSPSAGTQHGDIASQAHGPVLLIGPSGEETLWP